MSDKQSFTLRLGTLTCVKQQEFDGDEVYLEVDARTVWDVQAMRMKMADEPIFSNQIRAFEFQNATYDKGDGTWHPTDTYHSQNFVFAGLTEAVLLQLWEGDGFMRGSDDKFGEIIITADDIDPQGRVIEFQAEGAHYRLTFVVSAD